jgi:hypothetical protein
MNQKTPAMHAPYGGAFSDDEDCDSARAAIPKNGEENHTTRPGDAPPAKKRNAKLISDLEGKERDVALQEMKNGLKRKFGEKMVVAPKVFFSFSSKVASLTIFTILLSRLRATGKSTKLLHRCTIL